MVARSRWTPSSSVHSASKWNCAVPWSPTRRDKSHTIVDGTYQSTGRTRRIANGSGARPDQLRDRRAAAAPRPSQCTHQCCDRCRGYPESPARCPPLGLAYTSRWRGLASRPWGTGLPVQACWSLVRRRRQSRALPRWRPRIHRQGLVVVLGSEKSPSSRSFCSCAWLETIFRGQGARAPRSYQYRLDVRSNAAANYGTERTQAKLVYLNFRDENV